MAAPCLYYRLLRARLSSGRMRPFLSCLLLRGVCDVTGLIVTNNALLSIGHLIGYTPLNFNVILFLISRVCPSSLFAWCCFYALQCWQANYAQNNTHLVSKIWNRSSPHIMFKNIYYLVFLMVLFLVLFLHSLLFQFPGNRCASHIWHTFTNQQDTSLRNSFPSEHKFHSKPSINPLLFYSYIVIDF